MHNQMHNGYKPVGECRIDILNPKNNKKMKCKIHILQTMILHQLLDGSSQNKWNSYK